MVRRAQPLRPLRATANASQVNASCRTSDRDPRDIGDATPGSAWYGRHDDLGRMLAVPDDPAARRVAAAHRRPCGSDRDARREPSPGLERCRSAGRIREPRGGRPPRRGLPRIVRGGRHDSDPGSPWRRRSLRSTSSTPGSPAEGEPRAAQRAAARIAAALAQGVSASAWSCVFCSAAAERKDPGGLAGVGGAVDGGV
jgi:hypothetical protein